MEVAFFLVRTYIIGVEPQLELKTEFKNGFFRFFCLFVLFGLYQNTKRRGLDSAPVMMTF